jgi:hypothetical protein
VSDFDPPMLIVAFELERAPRVLNASTLTEDELRRVVDWFVSHNDGRLQLEEWLERHLLARRLRQTA